MREGRSTRQSNRPTEMSKATLRGNTPDTLRIGPKDPPPPKKHIPVKVKQTPPQAELLAEEYYNNLQQQLYVLNAELRFLQDRSTTDSGSGGSVDASIRRLRKACAMHEEETNKKIADINKQIADLNEQIHSVNEDRARETLLLANERELMGTADMSEAYVDAAKDVHVSYMLQEHMERFTKELEEHKESLKEALNENLKKKAEIKADLASYGERIASKKAQNSETLQKLQESIKNRRYCEEEIDVMNLLVDEPSLPPANATLKSIEAKNAKLEIILKHILQTRNEAEEKVDLLLESNIKAHAELNAIVRAIERANSLKITMDRKYTSTYSTIAESVDNQASELAALKRNCRDLKTQIREAVSKYTDIILETNKRQGEEHLIERFAPFRQETLSNAEKLNKNLKEEIENNELRIKELRNELQEISESIADARRREKKLDVIIEINNSDPRCNLQGDQPELGQLLESLNAVREAIH